MLSARRRIGFSIAGLVAIAAVAVGVTLAVGGNDTASGKPQQQKVDLSIASCGVGWSAGPGGQVWLRISNTENAPLEAYLQDANTGKAYYEVEGFGNGASEDVRLRLADGSYRFACLTDDSDPVFGPVVQVTGGAPAAQAAPGIVPVTSNDLIPISVAYKNWVITRLPTLRGQIATLAADVKSGPTAKAKADWLTAHLTYETLGAAYDAFGDADADINGDGTGFHKIEALLWSGAPAASLTPAVTDLAAAVQQLITDLPSIAFDPNIIALRAHEIVENAIQFELTGETDAGSHTNLATIHANLTGAEKTLDLLVPLLSSRDPKLAETQQALRDSDQLVSGYGRTGTWTPLGALTRTQREQLNASLDNTVELLSTVAATLDQRLGTS